MSETEVNEKSSHIEKKAKKQDNKEIQELKAEIDNLRACLEHVATHLGAASVLTRYNLERYTVTKEDMKRVS